MRNLLVKVLLVSLALTGCGREEASSNIEARMLTFEEKLEAAKKEIAAIKAKMPERAPASAVATATPSSPPAPESAATPSSLAADKPEEMTAVDLMQCLNPTCNAVNEGWSKGFHDGDARGALQRYIKTREANRQCAETLLNFAYDPDALAKINKDFPKAPFKQKEIQDQLSCIERREWAAAFQIITWDKSDDPLVTNSLSEHSDPLSPTRSPSTRTVRSFRGSSSWRVCWRSSPWPVAVRRGTTRTSRGASP